MTTNGLLLFAAWTDRRGAVSIDDRVQGVWGSLVDPAVTPIRRRGRLVPLER